MTKPFGSSHIDRTEFALFSFVSRRTLFTREATSIRCIFLSHLRRMTVASANPRPIEAEFDRNFYWLGFSFDCMSQSMIRASLHVYLTEICGDISEQERVTDFIDNNRLIGLEVLVNNLCQIDYHRSWVNLWSIIGVYIRSERKRNGTGRQVRKYLLFVIPPPFSYFTEWKIVKWDDDLR